MKYTLKSWTHFLRQFISKIHIIEIAHIFILYAQIISKGFNRKSIHKSCYSENVSNKVTYQRWRNVHRTKFVYRWIILGILCPRTEKHMSYRKCTYRPFVFILQIDLWNLCPRYDQSIKSTEPKFILKLYLVSYLPYWG